MKAVFVEQPGGVENLKYADVPKPSPGPGQALVKIAASGRQLHRYLFPQGRLSRAAADRAGQRRGWDRGSRRARREDVAPGDRVAYAMARGSYAEYAVVPAWQLVKIPASVDFKLPPPRCCKA